MIIKNILILGAGITGSSTANLLKFNLENINFKIFDKGNRAGGRFSSTVSKRDKSRSLDLGYKYISSTVNSDHPFLCTSSGLEDISSFSYNHLLQNDLIRETNKIKGTEEDRVKYISNRGFQSLIEYFLQDANVETDYKVLSICKKNSKSFGQSKLFWQVKVENGHVENVDCIVSTLPIPQLLELQGDFIDTLKNDNRFNALCNINYNCNWTLGLFFEDKNILNFLNSMKWRGMDLSREDNILDWISVNPHMQSIVVHANSQWSEQQHNKKDIEKQILGKLHHYLPEVKEVKATETMVKRWMYSQPKGNASDRKFDSDALLFQGADKLPFIVAGDGICGAGYENCLRSAYTSFKYIKQFSSSK